MRRIARWVICALCAAGCAGELTPDEKILEPTATGPATSTGSGMTTTGAGGAGGGPTVDPCIVESTALRSCQSTGCHTGSPLSAGLDLSRASVTTNAKAFLDKPNGGTPGVIQEGDPTGCAPGMYKLIDSSNPLHSLIYLKLQAPGELVTPPCGGKMPVIGSFRPEDKACILRWIDSVIALP